MKHLRRFGFALGVLAGGTGILIACGGDDAVLLATNDAGVDQFVPDSQPAKDVANDVTVTDSGRDSETPVDAGKDVQADVEIPPVDSGSPDADAGDLAKEFPARLAAEMCQTVTRCCFGDSNTVPDAGLDGGHYDSTKCFNTYAGSGLDLSNPTNADPAKLTYDPAKAAECLGRIKVLACGANAQEYRAVISACYAVLKGTGGAGTPCAAPGECKPGFFCNTAVGGGTCEAIRAKGAPCGDWGANIASSTNSCSNRLSGSPPLFCRSRDGGPPAATLPTEQWKCDDTTPVGTYCINDSWCDGNGACAFEGPTRLTCQPFLQLFTPTSCSTFVK